MRSQNYDYIQHLFDAQLEVSFKKQLQAAIQNSESVFKKSISLSLAEGQILAFLIRQNQCLNFVEIGTLTGHSALWIMKALDHNFNYYNKGKSGNPTNQEIGKATLYTFEKEIKHAEMARAVLEQYVGNSKAEVIVGDALEKLPTIESRGPFDGIFIDGNKSAYLQYLNWAEQNLKQGALIVADNVFLSGQVLNDKSHPASSASKNKFSEKQVKVMQEFNQRLADPTKYLSSLLPTEEGLFIAQKLF